MFLEGKKQVCVSERERKEKWCESDLDIMTNKNWIFKKIQNKKPKKDRKELNIPPLKISIPVEIGLNKSKLMTGTYRTN